MRFGEDRSPITGTCQKFSGRMGAFVAPGQRFSPGLKEDQVLNVEGKSCCHYRAYPHTQHISRCQPLILNLPHSPRLRSPSFIADCFFFSLRPHRACLTPTRWLRLPCVE